MPRRYLFGPLSARDAEQKPRCSPLRRMRDVRSKARGPIGPTDTWDNTAPVFPGLQPDCRGPAGTRARLFLVGRLPLAGWPATGTCVALPPPAAMRLILTDTVAQRRWRRR